MSKETKKVEETKPEPQSIELSEQDLDKVAGGETKLLGSSPNIKNNIAAPASGRGVKQGGLNN